MMMAVQMPLNPLVMSVVVRQLQAKFGDSAGSKIPHQQMFSMPCDVFIPAATSNCIDASIAKQLSCKFVVEAANSPTTPAGDAALQDRGIIVCPDIYASGGGVAVSWLEWVQNLQNFRYAQFGWLPCICVTFFVCWL